MCILKIVFDKKDLDWSVDGKPFISVIHSVSDFMHVHNREQRSASVKIKINAM